MLQNGGAEERVRNTEDKRVRNTEDKRVRNTEDKGVFSDTCYHGYPGSLAKSLIQRVVHHLCLSHGYVCGYMCQHAWVRL